MSALERGLGLLELLAKRHEPYSFSELTAALGGINPASLSRLLKRLVALGYVHKAPETGLYAAGYRLTIFANVRAKGRAEHLLSRYGPLLEETAAQHNVTMILFERMREALLNIRKVETTGSIHMQDEGTLSDTLFYTWMEVLAAHDPHVAARLEADPARLERIRADGYAYDDCTRMPHVRRLAFPLLDTTGRMIGAVGVGGTELHIPDDAVAPLAAHLRERLDALSPARASKLPAGEQGIDHAGQSDEATAQPAPSATGGAG
ncbi:MAG: helix-turn-helix domain-containing protein [Planctomycetota bacterium]